MTDFTPENLTDDQIIALLQMLFTNMNNLDSVYYNMFINTVPMDITLERYDANGNLNTIVLPNRAKDRISTLSGIGDPNGVVEGDIGAFYFDTQNQNLYYKATAKSYNGWAKILSSDNFRTPDDYLTSSGDGSQLTNLSVANVTSGILPTTFGGTGTSSLKGIVKANGTGQPFSTVSIGTDILAPSLFIGMVAYYAIDTAPDGWLIADGTLKLKATYSALATHLNGKYNQSGDDTTNYFRLPNLIGRFPQGSYSAGSYIAPGLPNHTHTLTVGMRYGKDSAWLQDAKWDGGDINYGSASATTSGASNSIYGASETVQPPALTLLPCIYSGVYTS